MKKDKTRFTADRRMFLKGAAVAGGAATLTAVSATGLVEPDTESAAESDLGTAPVAADKTVSKGYHETRHIKDYYRILRS
ncbi:MAG TPA: hypothetical protein DCO71_11230 [Gammaproteobacteria bacterium]|nr:hypothetical protein [Gammaproteobacteria bacterium]